MKFVMSKQLCIPKTTNDVHKELVKKPDLGRCKYELLGPGDKFRDENYEIYLMKCEEFKSKGKMLRDINEKALSNNKPKLGSMYQVILEEEEIIEDKRQNIEGIQSTVKQDSEISVSSLSDNRVTSVAIRKRHERVYNDTYDTNNQHCYNEPWFRRYIILCRFINAVRKVILRDRMLRRLALLKQFRRNVKLNNGLIAELESKYIHYEQLSYPQVFEKFIE